MTPTGLHGSALDLRFLRRIAHAALPLACVLVPGAVFAEVSEHLEYVFYEIAARPGESLAAQLRAASPIKEDGRVYFGHTRSNVRWNFNWTTDASGLCRISTTTTDVRAVITLPRIIGATTQQTAAFTRFIAALRQHELGHYKIALQAAQAIDDELRAHAGMSNCQALANYANTCAERTLTRFNEKGRQYDRDTDYGRTQGAWIDE